MSKNFKSGLHAAAVAGLLYLPALSSAALVSPSVPGAAVAAPHSSTLAALDFLSAAVSHSEPAPAAATTQNAFSPARFSFDNKREESQGISRLVLRPDQLRGDVDLFLWNLLGLVHAQRDGRHFALTELRIDFVFANHSDQPSAVPLPGALWLFVMGLLGLAGTRFTGAKGGTVAAADNQQGRSRHPMLPGAAVPA